MKIKKFKARNFSEALDLVKKELSEDAVILSTEEKKGIRPFVEVTAAVDYDNMPGECLRTGVNQVTDSPGGNRARPAPGASAPVWEAGLTQIKNEIGCLRESIESMKCSGYHLSLPADKKAMLHFLTERSVRKEFALRICEKARDVNHISALISSDIKVRMPETSKKVIMLIGPTGVGKTTTIAKLSAAAVKSGRKAAIINLDTYRIGAVEQVRIYSRLLGIPLSVVTKAKELENCIAKFSESRDIIFVDTTGRNPRDESYISEMLEISRINAQMEIQLLISANCDEEFMIDAYRFYRRLPVDCIAFTKVDEAVRFGALYNLLLTYQKPVTFITTGQKVPGDLESVSADRLANLILRKRNYSC